MPTGPWLHGLIAVALIALLIGWLLARSAARWRARVRGRAHNLRGQRGEEAAEALLRRHGYVTISRQERATYQVQLDDRPVNVELCADFVVERAGRRLVAEVKTGQHAPRFEHAETRRQLLEYQLGFGVDAVLLIEIERGRLREVRFPLLETAIRPPRPSWLWLLAGAAACAYWLARSPRAPASPAREPASAERAPALRPARALEARPRTREQSTAARR
jgi:hypothetical protein